MVNTTGTASCKQHYRTVYIIAIISTVILVKLYIVVHSMNESIHVYSYHVPERVQISSLSQGH